MSRQGQKETTVPKIPKDSVTTVWGALTWNDLDRWAGSRSVSRGRTYQRQGRVKDLAIAADGRLLATVTGGRNYSVSVSLAVDVRGQQQPDSSCTCPLGASGCKHAVAVVAEYLAALANESEVPTADPNDRRWAKLSDRDAQSVNDDNDFDYEDDDAEGLSDDEFDESNQLDQDAAATTRKRRGGPNVADWDDRIQALISQLSKTELAALVWSLVQRFPELQAEFQERIALSEGGVTRLVADARKELRKVTSEVGWRNHWQGEGHTPSYSRLKHRLERLAEQGHPDEVVKLGRELIARGMQQVGESHDEGETAMELSECLEIVFPAVVKSSLPAPDKILFAIDASLDDGYDLLGESLDPILDAEWTIADWSTVADRLSERLKKATSHKNEDSFTSKYRRDRISNWLLTALENADRGDELSTVYETEARATGSYERLVKYLLQQDRIEDAERWAVDGIEQTQAKLPGIASSLQRLLRDAAASRKQWDVVAAHSAATFFEQPSAHGFNELMAAAEKAKCGDQVRAAALQFLKTGKKPILYVTRKGKTEVVVDPGWLLPVLDYLRPPPRSGPAAQNVPAPHLNVLLEMAIASKQPEEVLKWYDKLIPAEQRSTQRWNPWSGAAGYGDQVAAAVANSHPKRALEIYRRGLDSRLPQADFSAYEACALYLKKMRPIFESLDRTGDWQNLVAEIRQKHRNRPRFMEILDKLEGRTILQSQRPTGTRAKRR